MFLEIERKFKVAGDFRPFVERKRRIVQGYLCTSGKATARIRISDGHALIGIKSEAAGQGFSRAEYEYEIPVSDATELLALCCGSIIEKERSYVRAGRHTFEIDVFEGDNEGLIVAEIELESEDEDFDRPEWLGEEVTNEPQYYNAALAVKPFSKWNN